MFGKAYKQSDSSAISPINPGYSLTSVPNGMREIKQEIGKNLNFNFDDATPENVEKMANTVGEIKGKLAVAKELSKLQLDAANAAVQLQSVGQNHMTRAVQIATTAMSNTNRFDERMSQQLLKAKIVEQEYTGRNQHLDVASRLIKF